VAGVLILKQTPSVLLFDNIAVDPKHQGLGIGRRLLVFAERRAMNSGFTEIQLYTNEKMTENIELYQRFGYQITQRKTEFGYNRIYMVKPLGSRGRLSGLLLAQKTAIKYENLKDIE